MRNSVNSASTRRWNVALGRRIERSRGGHVPLGHALDVWLRQHLDLGAGARTQSIGSLRKYGLRFSGRHVWRTRFACGFSHSRRYRGFL